MLKIAESGNGNRHFAVLILDISLINDEANIDQFLYVYRIFSLLSNRYLYLKPRCTEKNPSNRDIYVCAMRVNRIIFNYTISVCGKRLINVKKPFVSNQTNFYSIFCSYVLNKRFP